MLGNTNKRYLAEVRARVVWMYHQTRPGYVGIGRGWSRLLNWSGFRLRRPCGGGFVRAR